MANISIDLTEEEVSQGLEGFKPIPKGTYKVEITDATLTAVKSGPNEGKPMYRMEYKVIDDDQYTGRKLFHTICLWKGAHYSLLQLLSALSDEVAPGKIEVPDVDELLGQEINVTVKVVPHFNEERAAEGEEQNEVDRILSRKKGSGGAKPAARGRKKLDI